MEWGGVEWYVACRRLCGVTAVRCGVLRVRCSVKLCDSAVRCAGVRGGWDELESVRVGRGGTGRDVEWR
mgnify:CR=1 FL=1